MEYMSIVQYNEWLNKHDEEIKKTLETVDEKTKFALTRIIQDISLGLGYIEALSENIGTFRLMVPWTRFRYFKKVNELYRMIDASERTLLNYFKKTGES